MSPGSDIKAEVKESLIEAAIQAKSGAYAPYSNFRVGAALLTIDGEIIKGANIENASFGATICAERTALVKAVSEGKTKFSALAVTTDVAAPISPCGICRQFIREFCSLDTPIFLVHGDWTRETHDEKVSQVTVEKLLPYSFGPEDLERPRS